ncbi:MAG: hypothetical protein WC796_04045 [Candidatus Pacearchaeota archaeon]|jgi:predicted membrane protein
MCFGKMCNWHKNIYNTVLHIIAGLLLLYGSFMFSWKLTVLAIVLAIIGHLIQYLMSNKRPAVPRAVTRRKRR